MHPSKLALLALFPAALVALPTPAHADCALGDSYSGTVSGSTVQITAISSSDRSCPDSGGMLRESAGGEIVKLADFCATGAYVDECVPAGTYRYGFATPYTCNSSACGGSDYYTEVTVTQALSATCMRSSGDPGPTAATSVPWGDSSQICAGDQGSGGSTPGSGGSTPGSGGSTTTGGGGSDSGGSSTGIPSKAGSGSGCAMGLPPGTVPVLSGNALALLTGLLLMRRRRGQRS
jgi:hypothetical protein